MEVLLKVHSKFLSYFISLFLVLAITACDTPVQKTTDKYKAQLQNYLQTHLKFSKTEVDRVSIITDGEVGMYDNSKNWRKEFEIKKGDKFFASADHHSSTSFEITAISSQSFTVRYLTEFNHKSFGKNLISIDQGEVIIENK